MRQELIYKILCMLQAEGIDISDAESKLILIMNDYEITTRETALAVRNDDKNGYYLKKFIIAKTVKGCTERTLDIYKKYISDILIKINKTADEITSDDIRLYMALRERRDKVSRVTINNELRALKSFYAYLVTDELIEKNPCLKIEQMKEVKQKKEAFTEIEVEKMRNACKTERETAIVEILMSTGCRVTELTLIKIEDIRNGKLIVHGKGQKDRLVYLNAKATIAIDRYLAKRNDTNPYLFPKGIYAPNKKGAHKTKEWWMDPRQVQPDGCQDKSSIESIIRSIGRKAGVENAHPHRFRRTCATFALRRGMPIEQVSKMLGHENVSTTQIYLDLTDEELQQAHKKYVI